MCGVSKMMPPGSVQCLLVLFFINVIEYGLDIETGVDVVTAQGMLTHLLLALTGLLTRRRMQRAATAHSAARPAQRGTGSTSPTWSVRIPVPGHRNSGEQPAPRLLGGMGAITAAPPHTEHRELVLPYASARSGYAASTVCTHPNAKTMTSNSMCARMTT